MVQERKSPLKEITGFEGMQPLSGRVVHPYSPLTYPPATAAALIVAELMAPYAALGGPVTLAIALGFLMLFSVVLEKVLEEGVERSEKRIAERERDIQKATQPQPKAGKVS